LLHAAVADPAIVARYRMKTTRVPGSPSRTRAYVDKRLRQGKSKTEAIQCLKRNIAREVFAALPQAAVA
jgi:hypothetical protein